MKMGDYARKKLSGGDDVPDSVLFARLEIIMGYGDPIIHTLPDMHNVTWVFWPAGTYTAWLSSVPEESKTRQLVSESRVFYYEGQLPDYPDGLGVVESIKKNTVPDFSDFGIYRN